MRRNALLFAAAACASFCAFPLQCPAGAKAGAEASAADGSSRMAKMAEAVIERFSKEKLDAAAAFFGPVVKKYQPDIAAFQKEYESAVEKGEVIAKYMPRLEAALEDAKAMRVPARFEKEKASYIRAASGAVASLRMIMAFQTRKRQSAGNIKERTR